MNEMAMDSYMKNPRIHEILVKQEIIYANDEPQKEKLRGKSYLKHKL